MLRRTTQYSVYRYIYEDRSLIMNEIPDIGGVTNTMVSDFDDYRRSNPAKS